jgi:DNA modification methylase
MANSDPIATKNLTVRWLPIEQVTPYPANPRDCPQEAIDLVAASIAEFGFLQPITTDEQHVILTGHTRRLAALRLGLPKVPVIVVAGLSAAQVRAYRLMDNRSHEATSWNPELLQAELAALVVGMEIDPALTGFSPAELERLLPGRPDGTLGLCDPDELVTPPAKPVTRPGEIRLLGRHRLMCGSSSVAKDVSRLMAGKRAQIMATDWPYGVSYDGGNHPTTWNKAGRRISSAEKTRHWDDYRDAAELGSFYSDCLRIAIDYALVSRPVIYTFFAMMKAPLVFKAWLKVGLLPHQVCIWQKSRHVLSRCDYMWNYEPLLYGWIKGKRPYPNRRPPAEATAVWAVGSAIEDGQGGLHPTQKPVELIRRPIEYHTRVGEIVYEPFSGSGTALVAAEMTGRSCYAMELSPAFCDAATRRWENFTGRKATLEERP